ncbi:hypothetical protein DUZ99_16795 [Xylanibacillus composti]|uniref:Uncharacterized protein n=1 Tax=Xylanibacillus composti TaxID=1572762 RepID=A0A8J4H4D9_9BACL|nr:hypothetical protein [Xylanibacillus composti]MDT9726636.1 hypothetical protein [Xylanibacillus composti]GIQ70802.1 hypothetical protein XYCOK13_36260 [Xylanibacillus composti]
MPNFIPYLLLVLISLTILVSIVIRERQFSWLVLFFAFSGMVYVVEFFIMVIGDSYEYFPEVLTIRYYDNVAGAIVSNLLIVPALGTAVAVYNLRQRWIVLFATFLVAVEWLFTDLRIYEPHWWRMAYTWFALLFYFHLTRFWLAQLRKGLGVFRFLSLWMQAWSMIGTVMYLMGVIGIRYYQFGAFADMYHDDVFSGSIMGVMKAGIFAALLAAFPHSPWRWLAPVLVYAADVPLYYVGWLDIRLQFWQYMAIYLALASLLLLWNSYAHRVLWRLPSNMRLP